MPWILFKKKSCSLWGWQTIECNGTIKLGISAHIRLKKLWGGQWSESYMEENNDVENIGISAQVDRVFI